MAETAVSLPVEQFPALAAISGLRHGFTGRAPGLDVNVERERAMALLDDHHAAARGELGLGDKRFVAGQQVHGGDVAIVDAQSPRCIAGVDGVITNSADVCLGVYVADCCAVYLIDPQRRVLGLLHSGKMGTELGITTAAIEKMAEQFGCEPAGMIAQLSPCIRPPHYEVDIAAEIVRQCRAAGVGQVHDCGVCTAANPARYYSYRREKGKTGRMLALLGWA